MFLPSTDSFVLIRRSVVKPGLPVFLPNTDSFVLIRKTTIRSGPTLEAISAVDIAPQATESTPSTSSTTLTAGSSGQASLPQADLEQTKVNDQGRRNFLKVAGIAGAGIIVSQLSPKKAQAFIMGSSPTTGVVGVKDSTNARINPATEETLDEVLKTTDLALDAGILQVKVTSVSGEGSSSFSDSGDVAKSGLVDGDRHVQVDVLSSALPTTASTETTLQTLSFGGYKFTLRLATVGDVDYVGEAAIGTLTSAASWRIKKIDSTSGVSITWAGTGVFDKIWDNRASYSYS